jgi:hypothetical protein
MHVDFADVVRQAVEVAISGLLARAEDVPLGAGPLSAIPGHRVAASHSR